MANYITDNYLLDLSNEIGYTQLAEILIKFKNNSIGNQAQNFDIHDQNTGTKTTLYELHGAEQYLIIFWSSTCSHCEEELPIVKSLLSKNIKVVAIGIEDDTVSWQKAIKNFPNFIHVLALEKWNNTIVNAYRVNATPTYFLLDADKKIIAKPFDLEALKEALKE